MTTGRIKASLLPLPDELLSAIFSEVVYDHGRWRTATLVSTCRRLAPIVRQEVYRDLEIGEDKAEFDLLSELCAKRPDLRALVQVLHLRRTTEELDDKICIDYTAEHPCITLLHSHFPALHTLAIFEAKPADIFKTLTRLAATGSKIERLSLAIVPNSSSDDEDVHEETWWHLLARVPRLENLTLSTSYDYDSVRIVFDDARVFSPLQNLHSLTFNSNSWDTVGGPTLAALGPNLQKLRLNGESPAELETLLRQAPTSITQLTLRIKDTPPQSLQADALARFPRLERLSLCQIDGTALLSSARTSRIQYIHLSYGAQLTDQDLRGLVDGPAHMEHLKAIELGYMSCDVYRWSKMGLESALSRDTRYDLAQVKATLSPKWPQGCSAEGLREVIDAARKNGIKVYGEVVDCLGWNDRFDEHVEHFLVDDALASNDYTTIERYLGEDGVGVAILRQRPRLAELIRKGLA